MIPFRTPFFLPFIYPGLLWRERTDRKELYLTFDDGPIDGPTEFVLETLEQFSAKATFFCIGDNIRKHPEVFRKITVAGHSIGNHTYNHLNGWKTQTHRYIDNVRLCDEQLTAGGYTSTSERKLLRPPYGKITFGQIRSLSRYKIVMWDVLTKDYDQSYAPDFLLKKAIALSRPGSIVVFHDSLKAEKNLRHILPAYLRHFTDHGFTFKAIST